MNESPIRVVESVMNRLPERLGDCRNNHPRVEVISSGRPLVGRARSETHSSTRTKFEISLATETFGVLTDICPQFHEEKLSMSSEFPT